MHCKIADLTVKIPEAGDLVPRCRDYLWSEEEKTEIEINEEQFNPQLYPATMDTKQLIYMESGRQFYAKLLEYDGFYLHSYAVALDGRAYLFSGPSGMGKSTHTRLWRQCFGEGVQIFNDDKPALRCIEGEWIAYGTPWCGKDGININMHAPGAGICFLKQADHNKIRQLSKLEAVSKILPQTIYKFRNVDRLDLLLKHVDDLVRKIPVFELENRPELAAARLSYETMRRMAEEQK